MSCASSARSCKENDCLSVVRCQLSVGLVWSLVFGLWSLVFGLWSLVFELSTLNLILGLSTLNLVL